LLGFVHIAVTPFLLENSAEKERQSPGSKIDYPILREFFYGSFLDTFLRPKKATLLEQPQRGCGNVESSGSEIKVMRLAIPTKPELRGVRTTNLGTDVEYK